jgi:predicted small lipoprotein YifL
MYCWARHLFLAVVVVLGIGQMMAACGQKGDLYLPEPEPNQGTAPPAEQVPPPEEPTDAPVR